MNLFKLIIGFFIPKLKLKRAFVRPNEKLTVVSTMVSDVSGLTMFLHYDKDSPCDSVSFKKTEIKEFVNDRTILENMLDISKGLK
jgi:hypothetical protein